MKGVGQSLLYVLTASGAFVGDLGGGAIIRDNVGGAGGWRCQCEVLNAVQLAAN